MQHFEQLVFFCIIADYRRRQPHLRETGIDAGRYCFGALSGPYDEHLAVYLAALRSRSIYQLCATRPRRRIPRCRILLHCCRCLPILLVFRHLVAVVLYRLTTSYVVFRRSLVTRYSTRCDLVLVAF